MTNTIQVCNNFHRARDLVEGLRERREGRLEEELVHFRACLRLSIQPACRSIYSTNLYQTLFYND